MWRPTNDVVDCMTGTGGAWIVHPPPPPAWVWTEVPDPDPHPPADIVARLKSIESKLDQLLAR
jgi:hypothetical protein